MNISDYNTYARYAKDRRGISYANIDQAGNTMKGERRKKKRRPE
jgi:hypothetical protein